MSPAHGSAASPVNSTLATNQDDPARDTASSSAPVQALLYKPAFGLAPDRSRLASASSYVQVSEPALPGADVARFQASVEDVHLSELLQQVGSSASSCVISRVLPWPWQAYRSYACRGSRMHWEADLEVEIWPASRCTRDQTGMNVKPFRPCRDAFMPKKLVSPA